MHWNVSELLVFFCLVFFDIKMLFFGLWFILCMCYNCQEEMVFDFQKYIFFKKDKLKIFIKIQNWRKAKLRMPFCFPRNSSSSMFKRLLTRSTWYKKCYFFQKIDFSKAQALINLNFSTNACANDSKRIVCFHIYFLVTWSVLPSRNGFWWSNVHFSCSFTKQVKIWIFHWLLSYL